MDKTELSAENWPVSQSFITSISGVGENYRGTCARSDRRGGRLPPANVNVWLTKAEQKHVIYFDIDSSFAIAGSETISSNVAYTMLLVSKSRLLLT